MPNVYPQPLVTISGTVVQVTTEVVEPRPAQPAEPPSLQFPQGRKARDAFAGMQIPRIAVQVPASLSDKPAKDLHAILSIRVPAEDHGSYGVGEQVELLCRCFSVLAGRPGAWFNVVDYQVVQRVEADAAVARKSRAA